MKRNAKLITVCSLMAIVCLIITPASGVWSAEKVSTPFQYSGYSFAEYNSYIIQVVFNVIN